MIKLSIKRNVQKGEFKWLKQDFKEGDVVYLYTGYQHGCVGDEGLACSLTGNIPFFELPASCLNIIHNNKYYRVLIIDKALAIYGVAKDGAAVKINLCSAKPTCEDILLSDIESSF